jgi:23S rRNA pseudouridine1911/1915/1917 synthase
MSEPLDFKILVESDDDGRRLDAVLAARIGGLSRSMAARLIQEGFVRVDGRIKKAGYRVRAGDVITGQVPPPAPAAFEPEPIPLDILYEDSDLIALNKPAGLVVHPAPGHASGTLVNGLLQHCPDLTGIGGERRPGIVHRLDKNTSGVMVVAKNEESQQSLARQFKARTVRKDYLALVYGNVTADSGTVGLPIGRHPIDRKKMSVHSRKSREAETVWHVEERYGEMTLLRLRLKTGRTHQIRVHCMAMGHPIVGDPVYGPKKKRQVALPFEKLVMNARRQMLHARRLVVEHPRTGRPLVFEAPLAPDMASIVSGLRDACDAGKAP